MLLSLCTLDREAAGKASEIVLLTTDHRLGDTLRKLQSHNRCPAKIIVRVAQGIASPPA